MDIFYVVNAETQKLIPCEMRIVGKQTHPITATEYMFFPVAGEVEFSALAKPVQQAIDGKRYSHNIWVSESDRGTIRRECDIPRGYLIGYGADGEIAIAAARTDCTASVFSDALAE